MTASKKSRARLGTLIALALGAVAIFVLPGLASAKDGNGDRIPDRWEKRHHLSLRVDQARRDQDGDQLRNLAEFRASDDPRDRDSDEDGVMDGEENAGTIASFDPASGKLTIDLFGSDTISGLVTDRTRIKCEDEHSPDVTDVRGREVEPGDDRGGDNSGPGSDNSGPGSANSGPSGHDDDGVGANCTSADLIPGAVVEEAELEIEHGTATFDEVELAH